MQDFAPGRDTRSTRRKLGGFDPEVDADTFGVSPDGARVAIAGREMVSSLVAPRGRRRARPREVTEDDEPAGDGEAPLGPFDLDDEDETPAPVPSWLGALGQMIAALLVVVALIAAFIGAVAVLRRLVP